MASHGIDGRKLSRKQGPRLALYKNLTVSVLRYERVQTTEAKAKEIRGRVERMITLAKRGDLAARRAVVVGVPERAARRDQAVRRDRPQVRRPHVRLHPDRQDRPAHGRCGGDRPDRAGLGIARCGPERASARRLPRRGRIRRHGLRRVPAPAGARTVQGELEAALARLGNGARERGRRGRTHRRRGPRHGAGDRIHLPGRLPAAELGRALNALLPPDVAIRDLRRAPAGFHPRYAARYREYRYTVWNGPRSPLRERTALGVRDPLDIAAMARAGSVFEGRHDFSRLRRRRTGTRSGPCTRSGSGGRAAGDDRRPGGRLPPGKGPTDRGRPPGGRPRQDG